jgi:hypothetical protein
MKGVFSRRGQPLLALVLLLGSWVSARAVMWEPKAAPHIDLVAASVECIVAPLLRANGADVRPAPAPQQAAGLTTVPTRDYNAAAAAPDAPPMPYAAPHDFYPALQDEFKSHRAARLTPAPVRQARLPEPGPAPTPTFAPIPARTVIGHQMLWMAALARVPMPADFTSLPMAAGGDAGGAPLAAPAPQAAPRNAPRRWSADGWILRRRGSTGASSGALLTPSYGASQAGAVVRYRLAPDSALRPAAYLRTTAALNGSSEREAALGLQLRPVARLPLALAGEARLTAVPGRTYVRPSVFAVTELPPFALPLGLRGELYGQAGYVGGRFATGFADGQLRIDRRLAGIGKGDLRLGGGVWGGVQKGTSRLDAGPTLTIGQPLGGSGSLRLGADWRFRVAGKAAPGSGPAVTLSAGF